MDSFEAKPGVMPFILSNYVYPAALAGLSKSDTSQSIGV
jgi:hypothetical protein